MLKHFSALLLVLIANYTQSQVINTNFNPAIYSYGRVFDIALQGDKTLVAGKFIQYHGITANGIVRLNNDGTVDQTFSVGNGPKNGNGIIYQIAVQADNKILVSGFWDDFNGFAAKHLVRLNADGSVDASFNSAAALDDESVASSLWAFELQPDGKIITIKHRSGGGHDIIRLNADGTKDNTFSVVQLTGSAYDFQILPDGRILVVGSFTACNETIANRIVLLTSTGDIDNTFGTGANNFIHHAAIQSSGKIILVGEFSNFNGTAIFGLARINTNLTTDLTFNASGSRYEDIAIDGADNIYISRGDTFKEIKKFDPDGNELNTYSANAYNHVALQSDNKILAFGYTQPSNQTSLRLNSNFTLDDTFTVSTGPWWYGTIQAGDVDSNGRIVLVGDFISYGGIIRGGIVRLNSDLTVDNTLTGTGFNIEYNTIYFDFVRCQPDNKIIVSGEYNVYNDVAATGIIRLNTDGTRDNTFIATRPFSITGNSLSEGLLYVANQYSPHLRRLYPFGDVDNTFSPVINDDVNSVMVQSDLKIVAQGIFTTINGTAVPRLVRFNFDGSLDNTFQYAATAGHTIVHAQLYANDRILLRGTFQHDANTTPLLMLNADGTPYPEFSAIEISLGSNPTVLKDNTIIFKNSNGLFERLLATGARDPLFNNIPLGEVSLNVIPLTATTFLYFGGINNTSYIKHVTVSPIPDPPLAPLITSISTDAEGYPIITWTDNADDEQNFILERAEGDGAFSQLVLLPANTTSYKDNTVVTGTTYHYRIASTNVYGTSFSTAVEFSALITGIEGEGITATVYPNPGLDEFRLVFENPSDRIIIVSNANGQRIGRFTSSEREFILNLSEEPAGLFYVEVLHGTSRKSVKVIKW